MRSDAIAVKCRPRWMSVWPEGIRLLDSAVAKKADSRNCAAIRAVQSVLADLMPTVCAHDERFGRIHEFTSVAQRRRSPGRGKARCAAPEDRVQRFVGLRLAAISMILFRHYVLFYRRGSQHTGTASFELLRVMITRTVITCPALSTSCALAIVLFAMSRAETWPV